MKTTRLLAALAIVYCCAAVPATAQLIDFEDLVVPPGFNTNQDVISRGYLFDTPLNHSHLYVSGDPNVITANGTNYYATDDFVGTNPLTMRRVDNQPFRLLRADFAEFLQNDRVSATVNVTGNLMGGGTVMRTITLDQVRDGAGGVNDFQTEFFDASWQNLTSVLFKGAGSLSGEDYFALDNILTNIPEPSSLLLAGLTAIAGLVVSRRARAA